MTVALEAAMAVHGFGWLGLFFLKGWGVSCRVPNSGVMRVFVAIGSDLSRIEIFLFCRSGRTFWRFGALGFTGRREADTVRNYVEVGSLLRVLGVLLVGWLGASWR
jgi:hypothetical protein